MKEKVGIQNPFILKKAHFEYEVMEDSENVNLVEYEDRGCTYTYPEKTIHIKSLGGGVGTCNEFIAIVICDDALKTLNAGELITAKLTFRVVKDDEGNYTQKVYAKDIYTLNDYYQIREAEARHVSEITRKEQETD